MTYTNRCLACIGLATLIGCVDQADPDITADTAADVTVRRGVDYSWGRPNPATLHSSGYVFAARYVSYDTTGKNISASEANTLWSHGVDIVSNWENAASDALKGYGRGQSDAQAAQSRAVAAGMPASRPIYFSVDFDATPGQQAAINSYFDGVASVLGRNRTGAYGGYYPIKRLFDAGKIAWGWQTYAWSGGQWDGRAQVRQTHNGVTIGGADCDLDESHADDYGQWHWSGGDGGGGDSPADVERIVSTRNADGRLEVFWAGTNGALYHDWQNTAGGAWAGAQALGGAAKELAIGANADGRLELFYVGTNNVLYHRWQNVAGGWSAEASFGVSGNDLAVGRNSDGRLEVIFAGTNDALYHVWQTAPNGNWSGAYALGGAAKDIVVGNRANGALDALYVGTNNLLYHRYQTAAGSGWGNEESLGAPASDIAVASNADGRLEIVYPSTSGGAIGHMWEGAPNGTWTGSYTLGGAAKKIVLATNGDGRLEAIYVGTNDTLYHRWQTSAGWSDEASLGVAGRALAVSTNADGRLEVFYATTSGALDHMWQTATGWSGGAPLGGSVEPIVPPTAPRDRPTDVNPENAAAQ